MVCVEGSGSTGVTLPDKVAWILFVFVAAGPADPGDTVSR